ncbi:NAD(P)/FAD-dependent oxidoreductase [Herbidospora galbida]|uniref:NAD(P)/FAD-dependent oxidoreductase n=1 Tax=Herbidospora galbida TaxID=2575442 RepID=A0A4V5V090_9ACTN|nr:FAD/NAD(P)-binding oxidoreductase [Herbidospora galbida]TKK91373.1 NAD(P)/FAD-dependent oxidoreductase [Herbidospora galbida]
MTKIVIVLGAGAGGLTAAEALRERLPAHDRVLLVDHSFDGVLGLSLLWVMRGWRTPERVRVRPAPESLPGVEMIKASVQRVDVQARRVHTDAGILDCDALVVALGADLDAGAVPGLAEALDSGRAGEFYTLNGAAAMREKLTDLRNGRLAVLVAGVPFKCPAAPFEGALLAADLLTETGARDRVTIDVFTPDPLPMPVAGQAVGQALVGMLTQSGIGFHGQHAIESVGDGELLFAGGARERYDLLAVVPPHRPPAALGGWLPVAPRTFATETAGVWAIGDASALILPNGKPLPKAAVFAEGAADVVADGVARHLGYQAPEPWFDGMGSCYIELGDRVAAKGEGDFLRDPAPEVTLFDPSPLFHEEKADQEGNWLKRWNA